MTQEQVGIVLELLKRNVRPGCRHEPRFGEFHVFHEEQDGVVRRMAVKEKSRAIVLYGSGCRKVRQLLESRRGELEETGWALKVPGLNTDRDAAVWCQFQGDGREDWFSQRELVVAAAMRIWRKLKDWGLFADDLAKFRACLEPFAKGEDGTGAGAHASSLAGEVCTGFHEEGP